ncbi:MAG TPA: flagellar hook protein FlgE [Stellaceae bacterium]|nr:flagellar hook protein FlgE [Stellaceae bacterium]
MSLATELSGVNAAQTYIDTVGNNVANANTTGFKTSTPDFGDLYASAAQPSTPGEGVATNSLAQSFAQGTISQTGDPLDVAISGNGFFQLQTGSGIAYSRDGAFQVNTSGNLVNASGALVLGYGPSASGAAVAGSLQPITISSGSIAASATGNLALNLNLPTTDTPINTTTTPFKISNSATYNESTSTAVYDSLGTSNTLTTYYTQVSGSGSPPQWQTHWGLTNASGSLIASGAGPTLTFNSSGHLVSGSGVIAVNTLPDGAAPLDITLSYTGSSLSNLAFAVNAVQNNGTGSGQFTGITIAANGHVTGQYSNGGTKVLGTIALASFANPQGLTPLSGNMWASTYSSGQAISGRPGSGTLGQLQSSALEGSNVDLTSQLVDLIVAQQAYQANTEGINVDQQDFQKLMTIQ